MSWLDRVITFFKNGGQAQRSWSKGASKSWSAEKTWSPKKTSDVPQTGTTEDKAQR